MSRKRYDHRRYSYEEWIYASRYCIQDNFYRNFRMLTILILIILQFGKKDYHDKDKESYRNYQVIDNSILFIITLYFLSCY